MDFLVITGDFNCTSRKINADVEDGIGNYAK